VWLSVCTSINDIFGARHPDTYLKVCLINNDREIFILKKKIYLEAFKIKIPREPTGGNQRCTLLE